MTTNNTNAKRLTAALAVFLFFITDALKITIVNSYMAVADMRSAIFKFCMTFLLVAAVYSLLSLFKRRFAFILLYFLQALYIAVNLTYYLYFKNYLHITQALALFTEGAEVAGNLGVPLSPRLFFILLDLPAFIYLIARYKDIKGLFRKKSVLKRAAAALACLVVIAAIEFYGHIRHYSFYDLAKAGGETNETLIVQRYGSIGCNLLELAFSDKDNNLISRLHYGRKISGKSSANKDGKPNIVVIQVESMDSNAVNNQHDGKYIMPYLHSLTQHSVYYPYTLSYHEGGGTSDCEFTALNSTEPLRDYPSFKIAGYNYPNSFVKQLVYGSYYATAFHGNVGSYFNRNVAFAGMGFQEFDDMGDMGLKNVGWGAPDHSVYKFVENRLKEVKKPFFSYAITMSSHASFINAYHYYNNHDYDDVKNKISRDYMNSMSYTDMAIKSFIDNIRKNFKNTYIFIWGDHSPNFSNDEYKEGTFSEGNRFFEFVPMIILTPGNKVYKESKKAISFLDVAPTVLNLSGVPYNICSDGEDLLSGAALVNQIPYKNGIFDREYLYSRVSQEK